MHLSHPKDMTDEDACRVFAELGQEHYGTDLFRPLFARDVDINPRTVNQWRQARPQTWAVMLLRAWVRRDKADAEMALVQEAFKIINKGAPVKMPAPPK